MKSIEAEKSRIHSFELTLARGFCREDDPWWLVEFDDRLWIPVGGRCEASAVINAFFLLRSLGAPPEKRAIIDRRFKVVQCSDLQPQVSHS